MFFQHQVLQIFFHLTIQVRQVIDNAALIRKKLQKQGIYIPTLWPNVLQEVPETWKEWKMAQNILPLPVDQRYNKSDMRDLVRELEKCIS